MKAIAGVRGVLPAAGLLLGAFLFGGGLGIARQQALQDEACGFTVEGEPAHTTVTGPAELVPLVYVVEQPDSPVEILSVDLEGMWLSVVNEHHQENHCAKFTVRNRSNRTIQAFRLELLVASAGGAGGGGAVMQSPLAPGETAQIQGCNGRGSGGAPGNKVRLMLVVKAVNFGGCLYRLSIRIPRSLGVAQPW